MQVDGLWEDALHILKPMLEAQLAQMHSMPELLLVADFLLLFSGAMRRVGYSTTALDALIEDATEKYQRLLLDERTAELQAAVTQDLFTPVRPQLAPCALPLLPCPKDAVPVVVAACAAALGPVCNKLSGPESWSTR